MITFLFFGFIMNEHENWRRDPEYVALPEIKRLSLWLFAVGVVSGLCKFVAITSWVRIGCRFTLKLKDALFSNVMKSEVAFFDANSIGSLLTLLNEDAALVQEAFGATKVQQIGSLTQFLLAIVLAYVYAWKQAIVATISIPVILATIYLFGRCVNKHVEKKFGHVGSSMTIAQETLSSMRTVRGFNSERDESERFHQEILAAEKEDHWIEGLVVVMLTLSYVMIQGLVTADIYWAGKLVQNKQLRSGDLMSLFGYLLFGVVALIEFQGSLQGEQKAVASGRRILDMASRPTDINFEGGEQIENCKGAIEFQNVSFTYPSRDVPALVNVSFKLEPGQIGALVGHSGSGKTTCVQLLQRYYDVTDGRILIDGQDIKTLDPRWLHRVMGVISQGPVLFHTSIKDNIKYGKSDATDAEVEAAADVAMAKRFVMRMEHGFDQIVGDKGATLSGGQKQRIAIARAIIRDPIILIADEATAALDSQNERKVHKALERVMENRTCILIAHRLSTILNASKIHVFDSGKIVEVGDHEELIARRGAYYDLVKRQLTSATTD